MLSSDKLKAFASMSDVKHETNSYDDDFEGELMTIRRTNGFQDSGSREQTLRATPQKSGIKGGINKGHQRNKSSLSKTVLTPRASRTISPPKPQLGNKFELPARPDVFFREQSVEDFSDLVIDNDNIFHRGTNQAVKKVIDRHSSQSSIMVLC